MTKLYRRIVLISYSIKTVDRNGRDLYRRRMLPRSWASDLGSEKGEAMNDIYWKIV